MTNAATISKTMTRAIARMTKFSHHKPMVTTRLSGWINVGEGKAALASIIPTRSRGRCSDS